MSCIASSAVGQVIGLGRQPVAHERHRRGVISGVDGGLADGAGLAGGGRIDGTAW